MENMLTNILKKPPRIWGGYGNHWTQLQSQLRLTSIPRKTSILVYLLVTLKLFMCMMVVETSTHYTIIKK